MTETTRDTAQARFWQILQRLHATHLDMLTLQQIEARRQHAQEMVDDEPAADRSLRRYRDFAQLSDQLAATLAEIRADSDEYAVAFASLLSDD